MEGLITLQEFDFSQVSKHCSEGLWKEFKRLECLKLKTVIEYASEEEGHRVKTLLASLMGYSETRKRIWNAVSRWGLFGGCCPVLISLRE